MKKWLLLALIPSLLFAESPASMNLRKDPVYMDIHPDKVMEVRFRYDEPELAASEKEISEKDLEDMLEALELIRDQRYLVLALRPGSERLHRSIRKIVQKYDVDIGFEPWEAERPISYEEMVNIANVDHLDLPPYPPDNAESEPNNPTYEVELQDDRIILLTDNITVMNDELNTSGNAFESLVDRLEAEGGETLINFQFDPIENIKLTIPLILTLKERAPKLTANMLKDLESMSDVTVLCPSPIEVPANGREPIYLECTGNKLISVSGNGQTKPADLSLLESIDPKTQYICFLVRLDSFEIFRKARKEAWMRGIDISCELQDGSAPLAIGEDGHLLFPERILKHDEDFEQSGSEYPPQGVGSPDP